MATYTSRENLVEVEEFLGTPASAALLGLEEIRFTKRGPDRPAWNTVEEVGPFWTADGTTEVRPGDVFMRQAAITDGPQLRNPGSWVLIGETRTPAGRAAIAQRFVRAAEQWIARPRPGNPMLTANGIRMFTTDGEILRRPAVGEQDLDSVTGELLVDEQGQPVLVTA